MLFNSSDDTLVERALGGSQRSWEKLVARHELQVFNHCLRMTGNRADAMDLMQEVFLSIFRNLPSFRGQARFTTWMLRIASNKSIDFLRSRRRQPRESLEALQETQDLDPPAPERDNPDHAYDHRDHNREIRRQLAQLPPEQRLVVELKFFQHCTF
jgi:RNA polymerase sigma-70 factor (ECF subfamily)